MPSKKQNLQEKKESEINSAWNLWEMILYSKLEGDRYGLDYLIEQIIHDLSSAGLPKKKGRVFVQQQMDEMIEQIRENKLARKRAG
ncbi:hypothetical protein [Paenibacillus sp. NEAU-GSW1]|uniref:hypothetical protein n=1 Tax=Paenibacillus sp. NEAU-GSW1 TaxID=2682486 RepID=UPI0012E0F642|nr:hypothetical protein [Paenibacillus sp. NEAU-GSW1]MUT66034.1 hypothetical protein [Paenibacillus sp. NEAU-GSW1]